MEREKTLHIIVGNSCNNNCIFCMEGREEDCMENTQLIEHYRKTLERSRIRFKRAVLTYREPTLNPLLPEIAACAKTAGYPEIVLQTNGRMLSYGKYCSLLAEKGVNAFGVSVHGHTKELHESLTRTEGSFEQTKNGLENISRMRGAEKIRSFTIHATITKLNFMYLSEMYDFFMSFKPDSVVFNMFNPKGAAAEMFELLMPRYSDVVNILEKMHAEGKRMFGLIDFPLCTARKLSSQWSSIEDYHIEKNSKEGKGYIRGSLEGKHKLAVCGNCSMAGQCHGVVPAYIKKYGEIELKGA